MKSLDGSMRLKSDTGWVTLIEGRGVQRGTGVASDCQNSSIYTLIMATPCNPNNNHNLANRSFPLNHADLVTLIGAPSEGFFYTTLVPHPTQSHRPLIYLPQLLHPLKLKPPNRQRQRNFPLQ